MDAGKRAKPPRSAAQERVSRLIAAVLVALAAAAVASAIGGFWPAQAIDALLAEWFGWTSMRLRIVGAFVAYGLALLAVLLVANAIKALVRRGSPPAA